MKRALKIIGIVVVVILLVVIALPFLVNVNSFRPKLESELSSALGREVKVGNLSLSILSGSVSAENLSIADDPAFSKDPFIRAKALKVGMEVMPLIFSKTLHVTDITLDQPEIFLLHDASGKWNFSSLGNKSEASAKSTPAAGPSSTPNLSVSKLHVKDGRLSVNRANSSAKAHVYDKVNIAVRDFSLTSQFPFTLSADLPGGGSLKLDGKAGPINPVDAAATPLEAQVNVKRLDLAASGFVDPSSGIAGLADFDGTLNSDGKQARSSGTVKPDKLKLAEKGSPAGRPVEVKYATVYDLQKQSGTLTQGDVSIGKALAKLTGTYQTQGESTLLNEAQRRRHAGRRSSGHVARARRRPAFRIVASGRDSFRKPGDRRARRQIGHHWPDSSGANETCPLQSRLEDVCYLRAIWRPDWARHFHPKPEHGCASGA